MLSAQVQQELPHEGKQQLRLALALRGGASLAVWIGGALCEIEMLRSEPNPIYSRLLQISQFDDVQVDVLAGASAGGLNAAIYAASRVYGFGFDKMANLWISVADIQALSRTTRRAMGEEPPKSLLEGEYFLDQLRSRLAELVSESRRDADRPETDRATAERRSETTDGESDAPRLDVMLTTTLEEPQISTFQDASGNELVTARRDAFLRFRSQGRLGSTLSDLTTDPSETIEMLALAARASSSFPGAFERARIPNERSWLDVFSHSNASDPGNPGATEVSDGGILDNIPVTRAIRAIAAAPASGPTQRWLLYLDPDPSQPTRADSSQQTRASRERLIRSARRAIGIQIGRESLIEDLQVLDSHNSSARQRTITRALLVEAGNEQDTAAAASHWADIDRRRILEVLDDPRAAIVDHAVSSGNARQDVLAGFGLWSSEQKRGFDLQLSDRLRRYYSERTAPPLAGLLDVITMMVRWVQIARLHTRGAADGLDHHDLDAIKTVLYRWRLLADCLTNKWELAWIDWATSAEEPSRVDPITVDLAIERADQCSTAITATLIEALNDLSDPGEEVFFDALATTVLDETTNDTDCVGLDGLWNELAAIARSLPTELNGEPVDHPLARTVRSVESRGEDISGDSLKQVALSTAPLHHRRFEGESPITFLRVSSANETPLADWFSYDTDGSSKLAGNQLANFAAFLSARWRANDWMWGRLDGATAVIQLLGDTTRWFANGKTSAQISRILEQAVDRCAPGIRSHCNLASPEEIAEELAEAAEAPGTRHPIPKTIELLTAAIHAQLLTQHAQWVNSTSSGAMETPAPLPNTPKQRDMDLSLTREQTALIRVGVERAPQDIPTQRRVQIGMRIVMVAWNALAPRGTWSRLSAAVLKPVFLYLSAILLQPSRSITAGILAFGALALAPWHDSSARVWHDLEAPACLAWNCTYYSGARTAAFIASMLVLAIGAGLELLNFKNHQKKAKANDKAPFLTKSRILGWYVPLLAALVIASAFASRFSFGLWILPVAGVAFVLIAMRFMTSAHRAVTVLLTVAPYFAADLLLGDYFSTVLRGLMSVVAAVSLVTAYITVVDVFPPRPRPT